MAIKIEIPNMDNVTDAALVDWVVSVRRQKNFLDQLDKLYSEVLKARMKKVNASLARGELFEIERTPVLQERISADLARSLLTAKQVEMITVVTDFSTLRGKRLVAPGSHGDNLIAKAFKEATTVKVIGED